MVDWDTTSGSVLLRTLMDKAKLLDLDGYVKNPNEAALEIATVGTFHISDRQVLSGGRPWGRHKKRKNNTRKKSKKQVTKRTSSGRNSNSCHVSSTGNNNNSCNVSSALNELKTGKFGAVLKEKRPTGTADGFDQRPCESANQTASKPFHNLVQRSNKLKFADFYPEFDDIETEDEKDKQDKVTTEDRTHGKQTPAGAVSMTCNYCGKQSVDMKICTRCTKGNYCDQTCQLQDYSKHRVQCKREMRFRKAYDQIPPDILKSKSELALTVQPHNESGRVLMSFLLEIVEKTQCRYYGVMTTDLSGREVFVAITLPPNTCYPKPDVSDNTTTMVSLHESLNPGNFIIITDPHMTYLFDGKLGIHTFDLEDIYFIFTDQ
ncbi:hypothetical protein Btru_041470 [Bulinus truncatus]|nr:hypothetical protein Btru_041470 [Bulinus truncatus]